MPTENKPSEPFLREDRYIVLKLNRLPKDETEYLRDCQAKAMVDCVVVEHDWPEYHLVWAMIEHRMAGKPVPDFNLWRRADEIQQHLSVADQRVDQLTQQLATESAIKEPAGEDVLWQVLDAAVGVLTRRAAPHAWESEAHQAGSKIILARRAGLAATALKPPKGGGDECVKEDS